MLFLSNKFQKRFRAFSKFFIHYFCSRSEVNDRMFCSMGLLISMTFICLRAIDLRESGFIQVKNGLWQIKLHILIWKLLKEIVKFITQLVNNYYYETVGDFHRLNCNFKIALDVIMATICVRRTRTYGISRAMVTRPWHNTEKLLLICLAMWESKDTVNKWATQS
jgi:hypothetical protein